MIICLLLILRKDFTSWNIISYFLFSIQRKCNLSHNIIRDFGRFSILETASYNLFRDVRTVCLQIWAILIFSKNVYRGSFFSFNVFHIIVNFVCFVLLCILISSWDTLSLLLLIYEKIYPRYTYLLYTFSNRSDFEIADVVLWIKIICAIVGTT